jgi:type II secretory pathway component PulC
MYGLLAKGKWKDRKSAGDSFKPAPESKKSTALMPVTFHAQNINLKSINQVLVGVLTGLFALMIYVTFRPNPEISSVMSAINKIKIMDIAARPITGFNELSFYLDQIKKRDIFHVFEEEKPQVQVVESVKPPPPPPPKVSIEQKAKNFKLMGISWGNNPKAIITDMANQSMYFVSVGEKIQGTDLTVEEIYKDQVVISSEGDEMSMF